MTNHKNAEEVMLLETERNYLKKQNALLESKLKILQKHEWVSQFKINQMEEHIKKLEEQIFWLEDVVRSYRS